MRRFGVTIERQDWTRFTIPAGARYTSLGTIHVEGDASSASYFLAAGAIGGGPVRVDGVGRDSIQGDVRFADELAKLGARIEMGPNWIEARGPASGRLKAFDLDLNHIPDAAMTLAVCALFADGPCPLTNIGSWRGKENEPHPRMGHSTPQLGGAELEDYVKSVRKAVLAAKGDDDGGGFVRTRGTGAAVRVCGGRPPALRAPLAGANPRGLGGYRPAGRGGEPEGGRRTPRDQRVRGQPTGASVGVVRASRSRGARLPPLVGGRR